MTSLTLQQLHKSFGSTPVLRGIDLKVDSGEFLVLLGPSGCGKSTLLRILAGLEQPDSGELRFDGESVLGLTPQARGIGMVFQNYALYPHLSVRDNLAFGLKLAKAPRSEVVAKVDAVAQTLGLSPMLDRKPRELSGGQRQRVAIGRALVRQPKLLLLDEPLSNLDATLRVQLRGELARLHQERRGTMVYVTHDQVEAMTLGTQLAVLSEGKLQQLGPPMDLYQRPANTTVARFLGSPSMNLLQVESSGGTLRGKSFVLEGCPSLPPRLQMGVRPERVRLSAQGCLAGEVDAVEILGADGVAYVRTGDGVLATRFSGVAPRVGERLKLAWTPGDCHFFSSDGTEALSHPGGLSL